MNSTCDSCKTYTFEITNIIFVVVYTFLFIFICGGNLMTIIAIWKTDALRSVSNCYVALLAFSDFIAGLLLPYQMLFEFPEGRRLLDTVMELCLWRNVTFFVSVNLSICSIVVIAFDRAVFIGRPFLYQRIATYNQAAIVTCICLAIAVIDGTVCLYDNRWVPNGECRAELVLSKEFRLYGQIVPVMICFVLGGSCYGYIFYVAKQQQKSLQKAHHQTIINDLKIIKVLFLVYGIFLMCWLPVVICVTISIPSDLPYIALDITLPIAILNSGMNFMVYAVKNKDFRKAFKGMLCYCCKRNEITKIAPINSKV
ncbi:hypothetical protein LOTGIDRAFT_158431 [Lottia gigantea]|uniref:G-protein coupled receptors family 1 profile domain-containing protein n=1 Tax=Lottia gigantea TaxID=225164 RepID=V4B021_LOTGI|nr:hypothetical protein LOTGIDRAFT_158431 [Lottia gigantea]ESO99346.1 hypothetical protein LOTGIDRAFT_158431 [Lottia gigantea]